jgi:hypothetical protein
MGADIQKHREDPFAMPINAATWERFFLGSFAEHHVCSRFYFLGYEVQRLSPDVGIDWVVTNIARARFNGEPPMQLEVQVKSSLMDQTGAFPAMTSDELDYLCQGDHRYTVFVFLHGLRGSADPASYERGDDPDAMNAVDRMFLRRAEQEAAEEGRALRSRGALSIFDFTDANVTLCWLHSSQMMRLRDEGRWVPLRSGALGIKVTMEEEHLTLAGLPLIAELHDLSFIVRRCFASDRIRRGDLSYDHY